LDHDQKHLPNLIKISQTCNRYNLLPFPVSNWCLGTLVKIIQQKFGHFHWNTFLFVCWGSWNCCSEMWTCFETFLKQTNQVKYLSAWQLFLLVWRSVNFLTVNVWSSCHLNLRIEPPAGKSRKNWAQKYMTVSLN